MSGFSIVISLGIIAVSLWLTYGYFVLYINPKKKSLIRYACCVFERNKNQEEDFNKREMKSQLEIDKMKKQLNKYRNLI